MIRRGAFFVSAVARSWHHTTTSHQTAREEAIWRGLSTTLCFTKGNGRSSWATSTTARIQRSATQSRSLSILQIRPARKTPTAPRFSSKAKTTSFEPNGPMARILIHQEAKHWAE
ncbi:MAG: GspH/FimT family pseudopilin [Reyranella sp.]|nr:GspH/FimT family pseudopilin [Reyranella sp.]